MIYIGDVEVRSGDDHCGCDCGENPQHSGGDTTGGNYSYHQYDCVALAGCWGETLTKSSAIFEYCSMCERYTEAPVRLEGKLAHNHLICFWVCESCATEVRATIAA